MQVKRRSVEAVDIVFQFPDGRPMNGFWIFKLLNDVEKDICRRFVHRAGPFGWDRKSIRAAHIRFEHIGAMVSKRIIHEKTLYELSKDLLKDESACIEMGEYEGYGGFLALRNEKERKFFHEFELARAIINGDQTAEADKKRYQVTRHQGLYSYVSLRELV